jgi:CheY-like chemotaxis protein
MMPIMNGQEFLNEISKRPTFLNGDLPIVVLTAAGNLPRPQGVADHIKKPIDLDRLLELADHYCACKASA